MTTMSQKRKAVEELVSRDIETPITENNLELNLIAGPSKSPKLLLENLDKMKTSLRKEIMSDLNKILAENQKEILKLIGPTSKTLDNHQNVKDIESEAKTPFLQLLLHQLKLKRIRCSETKMYSDN